MTKKIYKLTILFDSDEEECEYLYETVDLIDDNSEEHIKLKAKDYECKETRDILIAAQIMGDA